MDIFWSVLFGFVQGFTEFWPVSSSGHLLLLHGFSDFLSEESLAFDVALHFGTLVVVVVYFRKDLWKYIRAGFASLGSWNLKEDSDQRFAWFLVVGSIPAALIGGLFRDIIVEYARSSWVVVCTLIFVALLFLLVEKFYKPTRSLADFRFRDVIYVGFAQSLALIPGVSRSGITIITGMNLGLKRQDAARFSFLLSVPVVFGATVKEMYDWFSRGLEDGDLFYASIGFVSAIVAGSVALVFLMKLLKRFSLKGFAYYRIALGILVALLIIL